MFKISRVVTYFLVCVCLIAFLSSRILFFENGILERAAAALVYPVIFVTGKLSDTLKSIARKKANYNELLTKHNKLKLEQQNLLEKYVCF